MKTSRIFLYTSLLFSNVVLASPWYGELSYTGSNGSMTDVGGFTTDNTDDGWQLSFGYEVNQHFGLEVSYFNLGEQKIEREAQSDLFIAGGLPYYFNPFSTQYFIYPPANSSTQYPIDFVSGPSSSSLVSLNLPPSTRSLSFDTRGLRLAGIGKLPITNWLSINIQAGAIIPRYKTTLVQYQTITTFTSSTSSSTSTRNIKTTETSHDPELFAGLGLTWKITKVIALELSWEKFLDVGDENTFEQDIDTYNIAIQYHF